MPPPMIVSAYQPVHGKNPPRIISSRETKVEVKRLFSIEKLIGEIKEETSEQLKLLWKEFIVANKEIYRSMHENMANPKILKLKYRLLKLETYQFIHFLTELQLQVEHIRDIKRAGQVQGRFTTSPNIAAEVERLGHYYNLAAGFATELERAVGDTKAQNVGKVLREQVILLERELSELRYFEG